MKKIFPFFILCFLSSPFLSAQGILGGRVTGNFQTDIQSSRADSVIGASKLEDKMRINAFANILYTQDNFTAGFRYESYLNPVLGFDNEYKGAGIPFRFASYKKDFLEITLGNYYEQFGNGLIFRSYEERNLGLDNAMDGIRLVAKPYKGVILKGLVGKQRYYWEDVWQNDNGLVRGADAELNFNELMPKFAASDLRITLGGSFVSVYEKAGTENIVQPNGLYNDVYQLSVPANVGAGAFRWNIGYKNFTLQGEYAQKGQDPNAMNNYIYHKGNALLLAADYSIKGFALRFEGKRIDNMSFKSKRNLSGRMLNVNYLPAITRQHSYSLMSMYSYATQLNGEMGFQIDAMYKIKKGTLLGGANGTDVKLNYSYVSSIDKTPIEGIALNQKGTLGYESKFFSKGDDKYFEEINFEINKKFSRSYKMNFMYSYQEFNPIAYGHDGNPMIYAHILVAEGIYRFASRNSLKGELQVLMTKQDYDEFAKGDWLQIGAEYNLKGRCFFSLSDQWNYGTEQGDKVHYYNVSVGYTLNTTRVQLSYGKQRQGILCIGGVCREVPASNGLFMTITSSF
ncbi:MAG: hypothetical protein IJ748_01205 [Bacteroidales bacterium]|nr:hypothetical protein [Bacteroidales bacterium]